jgi:Tfp pilus assembly protein PilX
VKASEAMGSEAMGMETMGSHGMKSARPHSKGFTLIASLLMLLLLSGIAIGLMMMVNTEGKVGGTDLQNNRAFHAAEGGIEKMSADLAATFQNSQAPTAAQICAVGLPTTSGPAMVGVNWTQYQVQATSGCSGALTATWGQISAGQEKDLWAQIIPVNLLATAALSGGQEVSMTRSAQVALIPVFQFGVFCEGDCAFFDNPTLDFAGRVHANGDLYLGVYNGSTLTFHQKLEAYGNVVNEVLPNGLSINNGASADTGNVNIPTQAGGCSPPVPPQTAANYPPTGLVNCVLKATNSDPAGSPYGDSSVQGLGGNPAASTYNGNPVVGTWNTFSNTTTNHMVINGNYGSTTDPGTGAKKLSMPFVGGNALPYEIIRRPAPGEDPASALATSREYNMAQIRVLLSDDPTEFQNGTGWSDTNNVRLANISAAQATLQGGNATATNPWGITMAAGNYNAGFGNPSGSNTYNLYFAAASNAVPIYSSCAGYTCPPDWLYAPLPWAANPSPALEGLQPSPVAPSYLTNGAAPTISLCPPTNLAVGAAPAQPANCPTTGAYPYYAPPNAIGATNYNSANSNAWSLVDGYLRVEYRDSFGNWNPVTNEWLGLGFARGLTPPTAGIANPINPNAILLLQEPADRGNTASLSTAGTAPLCTHQNGSHQCTTWTAGAPPQLTADLAAVAATGTYVDWAFGLTPNPTVASPPASMTPQSLTQYNWYPINFYDAREGEPRDVTLADDSCTTNGVMNAVEIDVGNLKKWLAGTIGTSGSNVDYVAQNGYVLYFSDRRGMLLNPTKTSSHPANSKSGDSGLEDVVNAGSAAGTPDGVLQTPVANSPEDVNQNGALDKFGAQNLGLGFFGTQGNAARNLNTQIVSTNPQPDPYGTGANDRIASCGTTGRKNWVSGARHVLKLVDGALGNVPLSPVATVKNGITYNGGFTVSSENPVYVQGDFNSNAADTFFTGATSAGPGPDKAGHSAAAVIADSVTILSNNWVDQNSMMLVPTQPVGNRTASNTYYRLAVAGGKNLSFPFPGWANSNPDYPFATDGGIGNFLRFLEDWNPGAGQQTLSYGGSLVSLYYATYNTGLFKCCTYSIYKPPFRNYIFDSDFTLPEGLPPGTPLFRDVETLSYRQLFATRITGQ